MFLPCFLLERCSQRLIDYDLNAPSAGGEFIVSIIWSNAKCVLDEHLLFQRRFRRESVPLIRITKAPSWYEPGWCLCFISNTMRRPPVFTGGRLISRGNYNRFSSWPCRRNRYKQKSDYRCSIFKTTNEHGEHPSIDLSSNCSFNSQVR